MLSVMWDNVGDSLSARVGDNIEEGDHDAHGWVTGVIRIMMLLETEMFLLVILCKISPKIMQQTLSNNDIFAV